MKELLFLRTKNVYFSYHEQLYSQMNGIVMSSPLGLVTAGIFIVELEWNVIPELSLKVSTLTRYVDDTKHNMLKPMLLMHLLFSIVFIYKSSLLMN